MVEVFKALSDPHRQRILGLLASQEMGACEIIHQLELSQPAVSHHLKILKQAGIITAEKQGKMVFYTLHKEGLRQFFTQFNGFLNQLACFSEGKPNPSPLRQNPSLCEKLGYKASICQEDL